MPHRKKILLSDSNEAFSMLLTDSLGVSSANACSSLKSREQ